LISAIEKWFYSLNPAGSISKAITSSLKHNSLTNGVLNPFKDGLMGLNYEDVEVAADILSTNKKIDANVKLEALVKIALDSGDSIAIYELNDFLIKELGTSLLLDNVKKYTLSDTKGNETSALLFTNMNDKTLKKINSISWEKLFKNYATHIGYNYSEILVQGSTYMQKSNVLRTKVISSSWEYLNGANVNIQFGNFDPYSLDRKR
jgi:hypothetical protein